jgi:hypothetical protein
MHLRRVVWAVLLALLSFVRVADAQRRTVVVVYDDSGSMGNPQAPNARWRDANYALQTLTGLLAPQDALTVVRMSAPDVAEPIDLRSQAGQIAAIQTRPHTGGQTPYAAVETAMRTLEQVTAREAQAGGEATEKWLIIVTDGEFDHGDPPPLVDDVRQEIRTFVQRTGTRSAIFMIAGVESQAADLWVQDGQARRYEAPGREQIVEQMRRIAADITSRSDTPPPVRYDGNTVTLTTEFPLRRVTLLQHTRDPQALAVLRGARVGGTNIGVPAALELGMPARSGSPVYGRIHHLGGNATIPAGTVTLTFDRPVDASLVQVLPEVDARLAVWLTDNAGRPLSGTIPTICTGEPFRIRATLLSPQGDTLLKQVRAGSPLRLEATYGTRRVPLAAAGGFFEASVPAAPGDSAISVSAAYPGYFSYRSRIYTVRGQECRPRVLGWQPGAPWSAKVTELDDAPPIDVVPTVDGARVPAAELEQWTLRRTDDGKLPVDIERTAEGWRLRPKTRWGLACCTPTGLIPVELEAKSPNPREPVLRRTVQLDVRDVGFWAKCGWLVMLVLAAILLTAYIFLLMRKRRFCHGSEIVYERITPLARGRPQTEALVGKSWLVRMLVPTPAERTTVVEVTFEAGTRCGHILIPPEAQTDQMYVSGEHIEDPGRRPVRVAQGDSLEIRRGGGRRDVYTYQVH